MLLGDLAALVGERHYTPFVEFCCEVIVGVSDLGGSSQRVIGKQIVFRSLQRRTTGVDKIGRRLARDPILRIEKRVSDNGFTAGAGIRTFSAHLMDPAKA